MPGSQNSVELGPMTDAEYDAFLARTNTRYARGRGEAGAWLPEDAARHAEESRQRLLPHGLATKDNYLYTITETATRANAGFLWIAVIRGDGAPYIFIYQ